MNAGQDLEAWQPIATNNETVASWQQAFYWEKPSRAGSIGDTHPY